MQTATDVDIVKALLLLPVSFLAIIEWPLPILATTKKFKASFFNFPSNSILITTHTTFQPYIVLYLWNPVYRDT